MRALLATMRNAFAEAYSAAYPVGLELTHEIYDEVASGNEIRSVILAGVYQQQRIPDSERLHPEDVVDALSAAGTPAELHPGSTEIVESIVPELRAGDVVAILSNGGFDGIYEKLPARLRASQY